MDWTVSWFAVFLIGVARAAMEAARQECPQIVTEYMLTTYRIPMGTNYRALLTVPEGFSIQNSTIPRGGLGVFAETFIPVHTWLSEYEGVPLPPEKMTDEIDDSYMWAVFADQASEDLLHYVDGTDLSTSNWLRYVNCPRRLYQMNVWPHWCYGRVYYRTMKDIWPGQELYVYYGDDYAERLGVDSQEFQRFFEQLHVM